MDVNPGSLAFAAFIAAQVLAVIVVHRARRQDQSSLLVERPGPPDTAPSKVISERPLVVSLRRAVVACSDV
jgi:hypothetical protein